MGCSWSASGLFPGRIPCVLYWSDLDWEKFDPFWIGGRLMPRKRRLATLNPYEDKCWVFAFCYYMDRGKTELQADKLAWRDLREEFPRLRKYDGCKPSYGMNFAKSRRPPLSR